MKKAYLVIVDSTAQSSALDYSVHQSITERFADSEVWTFAEGDTAKASVFVSGDDPYKGSYQLPTAEELKSLPD